MKSYFTIFFTLFFYWSVAQTSNQAELKIISKVLADPSREEIAHVLSELRRQSLPPTDVKLLDSMTLPNSNKLFILSHTIDGATHHGAVILPKGSRKKFPVILFATGGDGMHKEFDLTNDFNHASVHFPSFLGREFDTTFIIAIPGFRGQELIVGDRKYQSTGDISDAFDGAATDALAFLNVTIEAFQQADEDRIAIYGGSRGGTVALLAAARDKRIKRAVVVAAPSDMKALYHLYPEQFKLLFFNNLLSGTITESEARKKFISISPIHFIQELPIVQIHHDRHDPFVPIELTEKLAHEIFKQGKVVEYHIYDEGIHGFWADKQFWNRVLQFIQPLAD